MQPAIKKLITAILIVQFMIPYTAITPAEARGMTVLKQQSVHPAAPEAQAEDEETQKQAVLHLKANPQILHAGESVEVDWEIENWDVLAGEPVRYEIVAYWISTVPPPLLAIVAALVVSLAR